MHLRALDGEGEAIYLRLGALRLDERNVRREVQSDAEIDHLADLIAAQGLLQNLTVIAYTRPVSDRSSRKGRGKGGTFSHGVIAGGRRLRALLRLVERGTITLDDEFLCTVVAPDRGLAISTAENSALVRASLKPMAQRFCL